VLLTAWPRDECTVVTVHGQLDAAGAPTLQGVLLKAVAEQPSAVVCDLRQASYVDAVTLTLFPTVARYAATWSETPVALCASHPALLGQIQRLAIDRWMTVVTSLDLAITHSHQPPLVARVCRRLAPMPTAARLARLFVVETCRRWDLAHLAGSASVLASDLVTRAMLDSQTDLELRATLWDDQLHLSTRHRPIRGEQDPSRQPLPLVRALATSWGVLTTPAGDHVTWCLIGGRRPGPARPRRLNGRTVHAPARRHDR
jgi:anti-anti-sigma factor